MKITDLLDAVGRSDPAPVEGKAEVKRYLSFAPDEAEPLPEAAEPETEAKTDP